MQGSQSLQSAVARWVAFRVLVVTLLFGLPLLFGSSPLQGLDFSGYTPPLLIGLTYLLALLYMVIRSKIRDLNRLILLQLGIDLLFTTILVVATDGLESPFPFIYLLIIISSSLFFPKGGGQWMACCATLCLWGVAGVQFWQPEWLSPVRFGTKQMGYALISYTLAFFSVGILGGQLFGSLYQKIIEDSDFPNLRALHEDIIREMTGGLITADLAGRTTSVNRAAGEMLMAKPQDMIGIPIWTLFPSDELLTYYRNIALEKVPQRFEVEIPIKEKRHTIGVTLSALHNAQGLPIGVILMFQDLTPIRIVEKEAKEKERLAVVGEIAAGVTHEIRNPLASISGAAQMLKDVPHMHGDTQRLLRIITEEADRLNTIIAQFLTYAKPLPPKRRRLDLHALLSEVMTLAHSEIHEKINVTLDFDEGALMVLLDPDQMKQVFWNLVINAIQAMPGGGRLVISTRRRVSTDRQSPDSHVEICFADTGQGISERDLSKIFLPFFTTKPSGSGLGLAVVHRIVKEHMGTINARSTPDGTTFVLHFALDEAARPDEISVGLDRH